MKIKQVKVGPYTYTVKLTKNLSRDDANWGRTDHRRLLIEVEPDAHPGVVRDTLLHELLHACNFVTGNEESDEEQVKALTPVLLAMLRDNPELVEFLMEEE